MASEQHRKFQNRLLGSPKAVVTVAVFLNGKGKDIYIPGLKVAPTAALAESYLDDGDLWIVEKKRVEVKGSRHIFTCREDYPYPDMLIANEEAVDRARDAMAWFIVSGDYTHAGIVMCDTQEHWKVVELKPRNTGNLEKFYSVPVEHVKFIKLQRQ